MAEAPPTVPGPAITPTAVRRSEIDPFSKFSDQDLTHVISVALNALQARGLPPLPQLTQPPPPRGRPVHYGRRRRLGGGA